MSECIAAGCMNTELSIGYERLTILTTGQIKNCRTVSEGRDNFLAQVEAAAIFRFWISVVRQMNGQRSDYELIAADFRRLHLLVWPEQESVYDERNQGYYT